MYNRIQGIEPEMDVCLRDNGVYIFENEEGTILYVGKSTRVTDRVFNRVLNHCVPNFDGQQNTIEIWEDYLLKGRKLRIAVFAGITSHPVDDIKSLVYYQCQSLFGHAPIYNKRTP